MNLLLGLGALVIIFIAFPLLVALGGLKPEDTMPSGADEDEETV